MKKTLTNISQSLYAGFVTLGDYGNTNLQDIFNVGMPSDFSGAVNAAFKIALIVGAALAVLQLVRGGFTYMTSDIGGNISKAKEIMSNAVIGLLLLLSTYIILYQINPQLLELKLAPTPVGGETAALQVIDTYAPQNSIVKDVAWINAPPGSWCYDGGFVGSVQCFPSQSSCESSMSSGNFWGNCIQKNR